MFNIRTLIGFIKTTKEHFNLHQDMADEKDIQVKVREAIELKGTNLWELIFAVIIASIGLNINSTAVIIGAMLISPLMGPIIGFGFGLGIHDFDVVKKSGRSLFFAVGTSLVVSTLYFMISPLGEAQSEILARTTPTVWDVLIALSGGITGMIGATRKAKNNVIPGVAIATALMPPICTAGFGIATMQAKFFFGAFYLFSINSIFIAFGSLVIVRLLKISAIEIKNAELKSKIDKYIMITIVLTIIPSLYLAYRIVSNEMISIKMRKFIEDEVKSKGILVLDKQLVEKNKKKTIQLVVLSTLSQDQSLTDLKSKLIYYDLDKIDLEITKYSSEADSQRIKTEVMREVMQKYSLESAELIEAELETRVSERTTEEKELELYSNIEAEIKAQITNAIEIRLGFNQLPHLPAEENKNILLVSIKTSKKIAKARQNILKNWLKARTKADEVNILWD